MYTPRILSKRSFSIAGLRIERHESAWNATAEYEDLVQLEWKDMLRRAGTGIWDGTYYRVLNPDVFPDQIETVPILLGTVAYRYIATFPALFQEHSRFALDPLHHLSTVALVRTRDNFYVFGVRSRSGAVDLIGGGAQPDEIEIRCGTDLEKNLHKEIFEETGMNDADIEDLKGIGTVLSKTSNVLIVGHTRLNVDSAVVQRRFQQRTDDEMRRLVFIAANEVPEFLMQMHDYRSLLTQLDW